MSELSIQNIITQAEQQLLSPQTFYSLCAKYKQHFSQSKLYFLQPNIQDFQISDFTETELQYFFDWLAVYVRNTEEIGKKQTFYLQKCTKYASKKALQITKTKPFFSSSPVQKIKTKIIGCGMIGRVAKVKINSKKIAFKAFFDSHFVWHHGTWSEIPTGIYLKAQNVTKDVPEFLFAGADWAVWEWISDRETPHMRTGENYTRFAQKHHLTQFNPLNLSNYNAHQIRLDIGGVQKEYFGRRIIDFGKTIHFYSQQAKKKGVVYLLRHFIQYRLLRYGFPRLLQQMIYSYRLSLPTLSSHEKQQT
ncbi:hypothetical protein PN462_13265 [Spirulina sp. CS-785/01]|uniref:hypothetical protein n=1 Tax=Spirulina sp. CS-785/01 TaxID=3021716 RepID=UPI0023310C4B|nr:hypothetical protein [Spirulina sp. CS-785/01]MDB9314074.1 hypothetical protein [Spirulina sp. CS-785/01]